MANLPNDDLPTKFDVIVEGTGLVQSIVAAALARVGKSVLHIDRNGYYGELWCSLMHRELQPWMDSILQPQSSESQPDPPHTLTDEEHSVDPSHTLTDEEHSVDHTHALTDEEHSVIVNFTSSSAPVSITNLVETVHGANKQEQPSSELSEDAGQGEPAARNQPEDNDCQEQLPESNNLELTPDSADGEGLVGDEPSLCTSAGNTVDVLRWQSLESSWRRFSYDLIPKVIFCRGSLVELLTQSNCARYVEFKAVQKIYTFINGKIDQVPCSRSDVFSSQSVTMMEKRKMMKFFTFCSDFQHSPEEFEELVDKPFVEFLRHRDLPENLITYIIHSIAMVDDQTTTLKGLEATQVFIASLGRFGNAPFLYPIFGVGELGQAFCRLCAVFGGVYCLRRQIQRLLMDQHTNKLSAVTCSNGQRIMTDALVCSAARARDCIDIGEGLQERTLSRAVLVTDGPLPGTEGMLTVLTVPPLSMGSAQTTSVRVLQLDPSTQCTAEKTYMLHLVCVSVGATAQGDLEDVVKALCNTQNGTECERSGPRVIRSLYFNVTLYNVNNATNTGTPNGVYLTSDPDITMSYESVVKEARGLFDQLCPDLEFLPTPPDPSDIIYEEPEPEGTAAGDITIETSPQQEGGGDPVVANSANEQEQDVP